MAKTENQRLCYPSSTIEPLYHCHQALLDEANYIGTNEEIFINNLRTICGDPAIKSHIDSFLSTNGRGGISGIIDSELSMGEKSIALSLCSETPQTDYGFSEFAEDVGSGILRGLDISHLLPHNLTQAAAMGIGLLLVGAAFHILAPEAAFLIDLTMTGIGAIIGSLDLYHGFKGYYHSPSNSLGQRENVQKIAEGVTEIALSVAGGYLGMKTARARIDTIRAVPNDENLALLFMHESFSDARTSRIHFPRLPDGQEGLIWTYHLPEGYLSHPEWSTFIKGKLDAAIQLAELNYSTGSRGLRAQIRYHLLPEENKVALMFLGEIGNTTAERRFSAIGGQDLHGIFRRHFFGTKEPSFFKFFFPTTPLRTASTSSPSNVLQFRQKTANQLRK